MLAWAQQMHAFVRSLVPCNSADVLANRQWNGTSHSLRQPGGGGADEPPRPWQPYHSPLDESPLDIRIRPGVLWDGSKLWMPARPNLVISVPANCTDGYFAWLDAGLDAQGKITSLDWDHGTTLPGAVDLSDDNSPPPTAYDLLFYVTSNATAVDDFSHVFRSTPLKLRPEITNQTATQTERRMFFDPPASLDDIPA